MPVTKDQAAQLAHLASACRPHGARHWDTAGIVAAIGKVKHLALADVMLAVARAADDRALETPAPIGNPQAHCWRERKSDRPAEVVKRTAAEFCATCGDPLDAHRLSDHEPERPQRVPMGEKAAAELAYAREAVAEAKATQPDPPPAPEREPEHAHLTATETTESLPEETR